MNCGCSKQINQSPNTVILRRDHAVTEITTPKRKKRGSSYDEMFTNRKTHALSFLYPKNNLTFLGEVKDITKSRGRASGCGPFAFFQLLRPSGARLVVRIRKPLSRWVMVHDLCPVWRHGPVALCCQLMTGWFYLCTLQGNHVPHLKHPPCLPRKCQAIAVWTFKVSWKLLSVSRTACSWWSVTYLWGTHLLCCM